MWQDNTITSNFSNFKVIHKDIGYNETLKRLIDILIRIYIKEILNVAIIGLV